MAVMPLEGAVANLDVMLLTERVRVEHEIVANFTLAEGVRTNSIASSEGFRPMSQIAFMLDLLLAWL